MTSRVEALQRMCDNINENGGLDSGEWHTALLAQIAQNLAVIADVMMADRKTSNCSEIPNNCETCKYELYCPEMCEGCCEWDSHYEPKDEPQTLDDIGRQIQDAYDKGIISDADATQAWYEAVNKDEPQTEMPRCSVNGTPFDECGFCEYFNCDTCKCEADVTQAERSE